METRELNIGSKRFTRILVLDKPGQGNVCHKYIVVGVKDVGSVPDKTYGRISFQNGPVKECGVNGLHQEDLLAIVVDRLQCFQKGDFRCRENAMALLKIEEAMMWLNKRTKSRQDQGVEGTNKTHETVE